MYLTRGNTVHFKAQRMAKTKDECGKDKLTPITGKPDKATFSLKKHYNDKEAVFEKSFENGLMKYDEETNYLLFTIESEDTRDLIVGETYYCDIEVVAGKDVHTIMKDEVIIDWNVTNKGSG